MAFVKKELSSIGYTGAGTGNGLWFYANTEDEATTGSGYFNGAANMLRQGDLIYDVAKGAFSRVTSKTGATPVTTAAVPGE